MGWTSGDGGRAKVVAETMQGWGNSTRSVAILKHHRSGECDWFMVEETRDGVKTKEIVVMLWEGGSHKEVSESCGPYAVGCPLAWFEEVPLPEHGWASDFRERNRKAAA